MSINWIEGLGYLASLVVFVSLTMNSMLKLRCFNFIGCILFASYGFTIGSIPTGLMNIGIAFINARHIYKLYSEKRVKGGLLN